MASTAEPVDTQNECYLTKLLVGGPQIRINY